MNALFDPHDGVTCTITIVAAVYALYLLSRKSSVPKEFEPDVKIPPHVRSFVPYLGSAIEMGKGIQQFVAKYSKQLNAPIFTATIAGDHCLFIGDSDHLAMVYKYSKVLDEFALQRQFTRNVLGITDEKDEEEMFNSPKAKPAIKQYHKHLFHEEGLNKAIREVQKVFQDILPNLVAGTSGETNTQAEWAHHTLYGMVRDCVFKASVAPLLSHHIATDEAAKLFQDFDKGIPLMFAGAPSYLWKASQTARTKMLEIISHPKYLVGASDLIKDRKTLGFSDNCFIRASGLGVLFASVGNSIPAVFWTLYHILQEPTIYQAVHAEVEAVLRDGNNKDNNGFFTLEQLDRMVLLKSAFYESLRLYNGSFTTREAVSDFVFDPKKPGQSKYFIRKGTRIMPFWATLHYDPELFDDPETYQYDRFAPVAGKPAVFTKNGKQVAEPLRAFGGGGHLCPGRKFILYETLVFCAVLLTQFDMKLSAEETATEQQAVGIDYSMQGVGISHPNRDPAMEIRVRAQ